MRWRWMRLRRFASGAPRWLRIGFGFFCLFVVAVSANVFAATLWELITTGATSGVARSGFAAGVCALLFFAAAGWLYFERHQILDDRLLVSGEPEEPRRVLVTGLSPLSDQPPPTPGSQVPLEVARGFVEQIRREQIAMGRLAGSRREVAKAFGEAVAGLNWIQNIRAIWYHHARLERIVVVPSTESAPQLAIFEALIQALIANTPVLHGRGIQFKSIGGISFTDYAAIQGAIREAMRVALMPRGNAGGKRSLRQCLWHRLRARPEDGSVPFRGADISIDVTPGTKEFSIVAAVASFRPDGRFLYVNNQGKADSFNVSLRLGGGFGA